MSIAGSKRLLPIAATKKSKPGSKKDMPRYTKNTVTDPAKIRDIYAKIRKEGVAYDFGEYFDEINASAHRSLT